MSGIVGSKLNHRGSGLVGSLGTDGQHLLSSGAGKTNVFETVAAATYNDEAIKSDITALAIREATNESSAAFNLPGSFIETFTDDTNLGTQDDVDRTSGYISTTSGETLPTGTIFYMKGDNANGNTTFTDSSASPITTSANGGVTHSDNQGKIGSTSIFFDGNGDYLSGSYTSTFDFGTGEFRIESYVLFPHASAPNTHATIWSQGGFGSAVDYAGTSIFIGTNGKINFHSSANQTGAFGSWTTHVSSNGLTWTEDQWYHVSVERDADGIITMWRDGTELTYDATTGKTGNTNLAEGDRAWTVGIPSDLSSNGACEMFIDNFLIAKGTGAARGASYTPTTAHYGLVFSATGTLIQAANAVTGTRTEVGGTMLYADEDGTATLGTDLKIYFTCNGDAGSPAWTETDTYTAITPVYASGIKQVRLGKMTCTGGTDVRYKAVWANQSDGSKETRLHAIGINY